MKAGPNVATKDAGDNSAGTSGTALRNKSEARQQQLTDELATSVVKLQNKLKISRSIANAEGKPADTVSTDMAQVDVTITQAQNETDTPAAPAAPAASDSTDVPSTTTMFKPMGIMSVNNEPLYAKIDATGEFSGDAEAVMIKESVDTGELDVIKYNPGTAVPGLIMGIDDTTLDHNATIFKNESTDKIRQDAENKTTKAKRVLDELVAETGAPSGSAAVKAKLTAKNETDKKLFMLRLQEMFVYETPEYKEANKKHKIALKSKPNDDKKAELYKTLNNILKEMTNKPDKLNKIVSVKTVPQSLTELKKQYYDNLKKQEAIPQHEEPQEAIPQHEEPQAQNRIVSSSTFASFNNMQFI
jgi:hypothetical protein